MSFYSATLLDSTTTPAAPLPPNIQLPAYAPAVFSFVVSINRSFQNELPVKDVFTDGPNGFYVLRTEFYSATEALDKRPAVGGFVTLADGPSIVANGTYTIASVRRKFDSNLGVAWLIELQGANTGGMFNYFGNFVEYSVDLSLDIRVADAIQNKEIAKVSLTPINQIYQFNLAPFAQTLFEGLEPPPNNQVLSKGDAPFEPSGPGDWLWIKVAQFFTDYTDFQGNTTNFVNPLRAFLPGERLLEKDAITDTYPALNEKAGQLLQNRRKLETSDVWINSYSQNLNGPGLPNSNIRFPSFQIQKF